MYRLFFLLILFISLSTSTIYASTKRIEVDLTNQRLYAYENSQLIYNVLISSGRWAPTPTGYFKPWIKMASTKMEGGNPNLGTYYNLPGVPYVVYFYQGYAIHGAYWHNNFGHPMSHGCVNLSIVDAAVIYRFIDMDTPISIYGITPSS